MTNETVPPFIESVDNIATEDKFNYLLNFWYTAKLNKELEFVKRHGIHPTLSFHDNDLANSFDIISKSPISTAFYTVFRIYLEKAFPGWKFLKDKYQEKWDATWDADEGEFSLDNPVYTRIAYAADNNFVTTNRIFNWNRYSKTNFSVNMFEKNSLYVKSVIHELAEIDDFCVKDIDSKLPIVSDKLFSKLKDYIPLPADNSVKKKAEPKLAMGTPTPIFPNREFQSLLEIYDQIVGSLPSNFDDRTKFTYLLTYANGAGIPAVANTQDNFNTFTRLRTTPARRAA